MDEDVPSSQAAFDNLIADLTSTESANAAAYDKALLTLSSAALALSLAFAKDLVPFDRAQCLWLLFASWVFLVLALTIIVAGFMHALHTASQQKATARIVFIQGTKTVDEFQKEVDDTNRLQYWLNLIPGGLFVAGVLCLAIYVGINTWKEAHATMAKGNDRSSNAVTGFIVGTGVVPGSKATSAPVTNRIIGPGEALTKAAPGTGVVPSAAATTVPNGKPVAAGQSAPTPQPAEPAPKKSE